MMNMKYDIATIRQMVSDWYDGVADPSSDEMLTDFFKSVDKADLPDDLKEEADIFIALAERVEPVPDQALMAEIEKEINDERRKRRATMVKKYIYGTVTALAVAASIILIISIIRPTTVKNVGTMPALASVDEEPKETDTIQAPVTVQQIVQHEQINLAANISQPQRKVPVEVNTVREVSDVNEAIAILKRINADISDKMSTGNAAIENADAEIRNIKTIRDHISTLIIIEV